jgi:ribonuclease E
MPLFARYQVESYLSSMFNPVVQLRSGGYIVIGVTEALVAIDVNSGKATKKGSIEETALETNLEAAEEIARQLRLRDLAGLIVIDFIDMEERKNNASVEKRLKDKLKTDRARIQVGRISGFGLLEMSRQRLRPGMLEATTQPCPHCHGTGLLRSDDSLGLTILRQLEEEGVRKRSREVLLKAPVGIVNFLMNQKRDHILQIEARYGMSVRIEADPRLVSPDYTIDKFKTATRVVEIATPVISADSSLMPDMDEDEEDLTDLEVAEDEEEEAATASASPSANGSGTGTGTGTGDPSQPSRKKRRRRRRRKGGNGNGQYPQGAEGAESGDAASGEDDASDAASDAAEDEDTEVQAEAVETEEALAEAKPKARSRTRTRKPKAGAAPKADAEAVAEAPVKPAAEPVAEAEAAPEATSEDAPAEKPKRASRSRKPKAAEDAPVAEPVAAEPVAAEPVAAEPVAAEPVAKEPAAKKPVAAEAAAEEADDPSKTKRRGWWSIGR